MTVIVGLLSLFVGYLLGVMRGALTRPTLPPPDKAVDRKHDAGWWT